MLIYIKTLITMTITCTKGKVFLLLEKENIMLKIFKGIVNG